MHCICNAERRAMYRPLHYRLCKASQRWETLDETLNKPLPNRSLVKWTSGINRAAISVLLSFKPPVQTWNSSRFPCSSLNSLVKFTSLLESSRTPLSRMPVLHSLPLSSPCRSVLMVSGDSHSILMILSSNLEVPSWNFLLPIEFSNWKFQFTFNRNANHLLFLLALGGPGPEAGC